MGTRWALALPSAAVDAAARSLASRQGGGVGLVYRHALRGFEARLSERGARRLAQGELDYRVQGAGIAEIDSLADALNRMASQWADRVRMILRQQNEQEAMLASMTEGVLAVDDHGAHRGGGAAAADPLRSCSPPRAAI